MKYCTKCGHELVDEAVMCPNCGCWVQPIAPRVEEKESPFKMIAKIFMIIGCVLGAFNFLIPLCWCIPMTVSYFRKVREKQPVSTGFKVCTLLFVSLIAGILMFCDGDL